MNLTSKLAYSQLTTNKRRTVWTLLGIILSTAMINAVYGFAASGMAALHTISDGFYISREYYLTIYGIGAVLSAVIVVVSVIVVSNAFRVSAGERLQQFGILKSVGATKKQIAQTVLYEGVLLSAVGIPVGLIVGLAVQLMGIQLANFLLSDFNVIQDGTVLAFGFVFSWQAALFSIGLAFLTVLLSAWLPARKAAKVASIDAIRGGGEVKIKAKKLRGGWLVRKIFGFEGELAAKSLKRSKRNFRATVISLAVSIVLFMGADSLGTNLFRTANLVFGGIDADVISTFFSSRVSTVDDYGRLSDVKYVSISSQEAEEITAAMRQFPETEIFGVGAHDIGYSVPFNSLRLTPSFQEHMQFGYVGDNLTMYVTFITVDAQNYAALSRRAGVPVGSNILVNHTRAHVNGRWTEFVPHIFDGQGITIHRTITGETVYLPLHGELRGTDVPAEIMYLSRSDLIVIVPELDANMYVWAARTADPQGFTEYARGFLWDMLPPPAYGVGANANVFDATREDAAMRSIFRMTMVAIYGFVGMLTLIALTNVISTISANVRSRSREFAVLQSVGMSKDGLKRMLNLESILCSAKSLAVGIPLGLGVSYLIYDSAMQSVDFEYHFPWLAILQCVLAVFVITWVTMRFAVSRLRGGNIVENIR